MSAREEGQFSWFRKIFWPIYRHEQRMVIPMFFMLFLICFNYSLLKNMKDALVVTAQGSGAEVIPFIKVWAMLPTAVLLTLLFSKLSNRFSQERVFYIILSGFLVFYLLFLCILYPLQHFLHPHALADSLQLILPKGFKGLIAMLRNWTFTTFYVMCELWGTMVLLVLFWGFANEITRIADASRFYAIFNMGSNLAAILAGQVPSLLAQHSTGDSLFLLITTVVTCGVITMAIFRWMNRRVLNHPDFDALHQARVERRSKEKLSIWECFSYVAQSPYLLCIAAMVVGYNLVIHIVEVVWKDELRRLYPGFGDYNAYLGDLTSFIGVVAMCCAILIPLFIQHLGWTKTALITPITMALTGMGFFLLLFFQGSLEGSFIFLALGATPLTAMVFCGALQNISSKAFKYSFFDATKEMSFIPLGHEYKLKGKAAIDGVGSRLGKSGGSLLHQGLLVIFGSLTASAPYVATILCVAIVLWVLAVRRLGGQFDSLVTGRITHEAVERAPADAASAREAVPASPA